MSELQRRGTVSKSSGPTHMNSYALKGIPIRYHAPSFVSDAQRLLANQKQPSLPSQDMFRYDYTKERKVLEQSRVRTLSVIAEAEAYKKRQEEEKARKDSQPRPPVLSSTILMPTPVAGTGSGSNSDSEATVPSSSSGNVNVTASLGQFIRDLEGVDDPFEIASLQAINDMEMLQTVLQPGVSSAAARPATVVTSVAATPRQVQTVLPSANQAPAINQPLTLINQPPAPVISRPPAVNPVQVANPALVMNPGPVMNQSYVPPPISQPPHQIAAHHTSSVVADSSVLGTVSSASTSSPPTQISPSAMVPMAGAAAAAVTSTNPFLSGSQAHPTSVSYSNPFFQGPHTTMSVAPVNGSANVVGLPNPFVPIEASRTSTLCTSPSAVLGPEPSVGTLIDISAPQATPSPPIAIPNTPPSYASVVSPSSAPHIANQQPFPQPSSSLHNGPTVVGFVPQPGLTARSSSGPPPVAPKPHPQPHPTVTPISTGTADAAGVSRSDTGNPPPRPPKGLKPVSPIETTAPSVQSRAEALFANLPQLPNRPGLGIPILPPIGNPTTSTAGSPNLQPSPPIPARRHTPPPPYYMEQERMSTRPQQAPVPRPRTYKLPDPLPGMSAKEKATVQSLSGMGFPGPRVARAVKKFSNDRTKTVDFLIAVGKLEDQGYSGDGLETALIASGEDHNKAIDYLKRVNQYKNIGFPEKAIHEAYEKANKDWDQVLDVLTQERQ